ncbi:MAG: IS1595 family transposase [Syntrophorhabdaceae bacterium]|nr:IS1595 family transposase [Syntrophorhabdaceae bacterium]
MPRIPDAGAESLLSFISDVIEPGSQVHTDGWSGYSGINEAGCQHIITNLKQSATSASELLPRVHLVASLLKRWILGTHQGAVSPAHLDGYLNEFTFRFNRRTSSSRGMLFYRLLQNAMRTEPAPYKKIIKGARSGPEKSPRKRSDLT